MPAATMMSGTESPSNFAVLTLTPPRKFPPNAGTNDFTTRGWFVTSNTLTCGAMPAPLPTMISPLPSGTLLRSATATLAPPRKLAAKAAKARYGLFSTGSAAAGRDRNTATLPGPRDAPATMSSTPSPSTSPEAISTPML